MRGPSVHEPQAISNDHHRIRLGLKVEPPRRLRICPTVHRHRDEVRTVLEVAENHRSLMAGAPPDGRQVQRAPPSGFRAPQPDSSTRDSVHAPVHNPSEADEPARRNTRWSPPCLRHGGSLVARDGSHDRPVSAWAVLCWRTTARMHVRPRHPGSTALPTMQSSSWLSPAVPARHEGQPIASALREKRLVNPCEG